MTELEKLQKKFREIKDRLKVVRAIKFEDMTDELREERSKLVAEYEKVAEYIKQEERASRIDDLDSVDVSDFDGDAGIEVQDQPIYRSRFPLGEQCRDMITVAKDKRGQAYDDARTRLDETINREISIQEKRTAGTGMVEAVAEDGGYLLQGESIIDLMTNGWNNNAVLSRTDNLTIGGMFYDQYGIDEDSRVDDSRGGGVRWYNDIELADITSSKTTLKKTRWEPKRLTGLYYMSNEINNDVPALQSEMNKLFGEELAFRKQEMVFRGTGSGEALGLLNAPNLVSQAKETGQTKETIVYRNTTKMMSRLMLKNFSGLVWLVNQDVMDQLLNLTVEVGTGGSVSTAFMPNFSGTPGIIGTLHGYPVVPIEQASTLGTVGDIVLTDLSQYKTVDRGGVETAVSGHVMFLYNQTAVRFVTHFDGQPKQKAALTPNKGSNTVSSTVVLATRA